MQRGFGCSDAPTNPTESPARGCLRQGDLRKKAPAKYIIPDR
jgi:hypothetical protein